MAKNASAFKTNLAQEAIPESPVQSAPSKSFPKKESRSPNIAPNPNPDKITDEEEPKTRLLPGNPTEKAATRGNSVTPTPATSGATNGKPKTTATTKSAPKAAPVSTSAKSVSKAPKSPNTLRPTTSTTKPQARATSLPPQKKPAPTKDHDAPKKATTSAATKSTVTSGKKPASIDLPPSGTGFVKPKPKSPTRPIKLPSSLTAPTTAFASKLGTGSTAHPPRQSLSRASGNAQHLNVGSTTHRSPSRASITTTGTSSQTKGLKRQSSTISRPRPSLGPPPKPASKDHPVAKKDAQVDEGFLARMMRPTQASSSKTSEKAPLTPPRKQSAPATAHKKPVAKEAEASAKKAAAKIQAATNKGKAAVETAKPTSKAAPTAKEVAPVVAQTETAEAAIETAKVSTDTAATPVVEAVAEAASAGESTTVPAVTEDAQKVEDIEDLVQEAIEEPVSQSPAEPAVEVSTTGTEERQEAEVPAASGEAAGAVGQAEGQSSEAEEPKALEAEETKAEAPEVEDVQVHEAKSEIPPNDV
ncbi:hypothetical protein F5Y05DRAFT_87616 [Hypoxylon sp. FL0543]|nr:hypothetical protein F5Y05DRAFT_87616 [Hypoxylon sp. FL0543]